MEASQVNHENSTVNLRNATKHDWDYTHRLFIEAENPVFGISMINSDYQRYFGARETIIPGMNANGAHEFDSHFYIIEGVSGTPIGIMTNKRFKDGRPELIGILVEKGSQARGVGTKMVALLAKQRINAGSKVEALVSPGNKNSIKMCTYSGGKIVGRRHLEIGGVSMDMLVFSFSGSQTKPLKGWALA